MIEDAGTSGTGPSDIEDEDAARRYLDEVRRQIDDEVRRRRVSGDLPLDVERDLDQQFLRHSPLGGRGAALRDMLRLVDASVFIDPVVPVESRRPGGTTVKRGLRSLSLWYLRYVTHQVSEFATAVSRALHVLDAQVTDLRRKVDALPVPAPVTVEVPWAHDPGAWWVGAVTERLAGGPGRVLHAACGDGWLVAALVERGVDAYGVDPRHRVRALDLDDLDLRVEDVSEHLGAVASGSLHAVVLSGVVEGSGPVERAQLVEEAVRCLAPSGALFVHSLTPASWAADDAPLEADLVSARPYRPRTWQSVLEDLGLDATVADGPAGRDYLVTARPRGGGRRSPR
ncbi:MAG: methyltransferase domain-containing protein [Acidimicrobiales bacterium]|nr:methyltransferase domain-containing protein [Acidimicrobiales bacterium]